jgi:predicted DNA-binding transcriptional regulator YafY
VPLFGAVVERRRVRFTYNTQPREVDPWRLTSERGHWYLQGYDHERQAERLYRVDRIESRDGVAVVETIGPPQAFERPPARSRATLAPWLFGDEVETHAEVLVDAELVEWVADVHGLTAAEVRADGSAVFVLPVANRTAFRSFVLGLLDHAEVVGPPGLRAEIVNWLREVP